MTTLSRGRPAHALLAIALTVAASSAAAGTVTVFTDRVQWEKAAVAASGFETIITETFEDEIPGPLDSGSNRFWSDPSGILYIDILGVPGRNSIDDGITTPELSPNGSIYYLGEVGVGTTPQLLFQPIAAPPATYGFGADWVLGGAGIGIEVLGTAITLSDYLPGGEGFLGVITSEFISERQPVLLLSDLGTQAFGMDNISYTWVPIPSALVLLLCGLGTLGSVAVPGVRGTRLG